MRIWAGQDSGDAARCQGAQPCIGIRYETAKESRSAARRHAWVVEGGRKNDGLVDGSRLCERRIGGLQTEARCVWFRPGGEPAWLAVVFQKHNFATPPARDAMSQV